RLHCPGPGPGVKYPLKRGEKPVTIGRIRADCLRSPSGVVMPIRFRCAYCNQLMGISRRKAGTVVRCPSCSGQVVVPNPSAEPTEKPHEAPSPKPVPQPHLFERSNFEELFDDAAGGKRAVRSEERRVGK